MERFHGKGGSVVVELRIYNEEQMIEVRVEKDDGGRALTYLDPSEARRLAYRLLGDAEYLDGLHLTSFKQAAEVLKKREQEAKEPVNRVPSTPPDTTIPTVPA